MNAIGVMLNNLEPDRLRAWSVAAAMGFRVVHTSALPEAWLTGPPLADYIAAARASGLSVHSMFAGFDGQSYADPASAARTVGLAVPLLRAHRLAIARAYIPVAKALNAAALALHVGCLPPASGADYGNLVTVVAALADDCGDAGLRLHLETGMEPAPVLKRFVIDANRPNIGVNFDPANFLLYGTDEPLAALDELGPYLGGVHCKDALPPQQDGRMGVDVPLGRGRVDFPRLLARLRGLSYEGPLVIEREHGPNVRSDIEQGRAYLEQLLTSEPTS